MIGKECPVCRTRLNAVGTFFRPAWARWHCAACGSVIGISTVRRLLAIAIWMAVLFAWMFLMRGAAVPLLIVLCGLVPLCFMTIAGLDRLVVIERLGFHCRSCGYDLRGSGDEQCAECGAAIDPELRERVAHVASLSADRLRARSAVRWGIVIAVFLLCTTLMLVGLTIYMRQMRRGPAVGPGQPNQLPARPGGGTPSAR